MLEPLTPALYAMDEPEQTVLELRMLDLLPTDVVAGLRHRFGARFDQLEHTARLILATAVIERVVNHTRLLAICGIHARDLSLLLARMVRDGWLGADGRARGTFYHLPGEMPPTPEQVFVLAPTSSEHNDGSSEHNAAHNGGSSEHNDRSCEHNAAHKGGSSEHNAGSSEHNGGPKGHRNADGCLLSEHLDAPLIDSLEELSEELLTQLSVFAEEPRERQRMAPSRMRELIRLLCKDHYITLNVLALLLNRSPTALRLHYLNSMVKARDVQLAFPSKPTHIRQAYKASSAGNSHES